MELPLPNLSPAFQALYCDPTVFESFSEFHPISFVRVLPFQGADKVVDDAQLIWAEQDLLADRNENTQQRVVEEFLRCGLLEPADALNLKSVIDLFEADFFGLMGQVYADARTFICALRWYREWIQFLESQKPDMRSDYESVYASVGYALYSLGLFEEAIAWSKSCIGPRQLADVVCRALITYETREGGGAIRAVDRVGPRVRYYVSVFDPAFSSQAGPRIKAAMKDFAPFHEVYMDWMSSNAPVKELEPFGYAFAPEFDGGSLPRHKMNLIFATCSRADTLIEKGYVVEAKQLLEEVSMMEPQAICVRERLQLL